MKSTRVFITFFSGTLIQITNNHFLFLSFALRPGGPRRRNPEYSGPGAISLRSIAPAKAAYAATGLFFSSIIIE